MAADWRGGASDCAGSSWSYRWGGLLNVAAILLFIANSARALLLGLQPSTRLSAAPESTRSLRRLTD